MTPTLERMTGLHWTDADGITKISDDAFCTISEAAAQHRPKRCGDRARVMNRHTWTKGPRCKAIFVELAASGIIDDKRRLTEKGAVIAFVGREIYADHFEFPF